MSDPLLLPLAAVIVGILFGRGLDFSLHEVGWWVAALVGMAVAARLLTSRWLARTAAGVALVSVGVFLEAWHRPGPSPEIDAGPRETVLLAGCVVEPAVFSPDREQFTLELAPGARARVTLSLEEGDLTSEPAPPLRYGQRVEIEARVRPPHNFNNPGSFDYVTYLARQKIFWTATMPRGSPPRILDGRCGSRLMAGIFALRTAALNRMERLYAEDEYSLGMMEAVLIGETARLARVWTENFRRTGTFHALVISGVHVTVLAGVLLFLLRLVPIPEMAALAVTAAAAWLYAAVSGFSAPVVRAAGGFSLYLIARFFFRRGRVLNLLAAVALVYLAWDPDQLFEASFQLSFLSVAAIGALATPMIEASSGPLARGLRSISQLESDPHLEPRVAQFRVEVRLVAETLHLWTRIPVRWSRELLAFALRGALFAFEMAALSAVIQVGLALPMAEYFHRVSFTGLSANLLIVPALNAAIPIGFLAIFTGWHWVASVAAWLLWFAAKIADWHARIEPSWRVPDPPAWLALAFVTALLAFAMVVAMPTRRRLLARKGPIAALNPSKQSLGRLPRSRLRFAGDYLGARNGPVAAHDSVQPPPNSKPRPRLRFAGRNLGAWAAAALVFGFFGLLLWQPWPAHTGTGQLELTAINVGQGDSLLMVLPRGQLMLIDTGGLLQFGRAHRSNLDIGEDVVSPYLWSRGIRRLDVLAATHAHQDHIGGLEAVLTNFRPRELWIGANFPPELIERASRLGVRVIEKRAGTPIELGGAQFEVLSPPADYVPAKPGNPANNDSLAMRVTFGLRSFLLTGDMEKPMEARLLLDGRLQHADVLKVGHHGSKTSTVEPFLESVSPSVALVSAGFENSFGHPHPDVLARLVAHNTTVLRTDLDGLASVRTDGTRLWFGIQAWEPRAAALRLPGLSFTGW